MYSYIMQCTDSARLLLSLRRRYIEKEVPSRGEAFFVHWSPISLEASLDEANARLQRKDGGHSLSKMPAPTVFTASHIIALP